MSLSQTKSLKKRFHKSRATFKRRQADKLATKAFVFQDRAAKQQYNKLIDEAYAHQQKCC